MSKMHFHYIVPGDDFTRAGEASSSVKKKLKQLGYDPDATRRVAIAMYEGEINMVIHAGGGEIDVDVSLGFGAGMGLPNIKKYSDDMRIDTELGKGTTMYFSVFPKN